MCEWVAGETGALDGRLGVAAYEEFDLVLKGATLEGRQRASGGHGSGARGLWWLARRGRRFKRPRW